MSKHPEQKPWKSLGEPIHGFDSTNGVVDVTEDQVADDEESEVMAAIRRTGQANIAGLGGF